MILLGENYYCTSPIKKAVLLIKPNSDHPHHIY